MSTRGRPYARKTGDKVSYSQQQKDQYLSQVPRWQKGKSLRPSGSDKVPEGRKYYYPSRRSPAGRWEVLCRLPEGDLEQNQGGDGGGGGFPGDLTCLPKNLEYVYVKESTVGSLLTAPGREGPFTGGPFASSKQYITIAPGFTARVPLLADVQFRFMQNFGTTTEGLACTFGAFKSITSSGFDSDGGGMSQAVGTSYYLIFNGLLYFIGGSQSSSGEGSGLSSGYSIGFGFTSVSMAYYYSDGSVEMFGGPAPPLDGIPYPDGMSGGEEEEKKVYSCNCPDATERQGALVRSRYASERRFRDWSKSRTGARFGECKHVYATRMFRGERVGMPSLSDPRHLHGTRPFRLEFAGAAEDAVAADDSFEVGVRRRREGYRRRGAEFNDPSGNGKAARQQLRTIRRRERAERVARGEQIQRLDRERQERLRNPQQAEALDLSNPAVREREEARHREYIDELYGEGFYDSAPARIRRAIDGGVERIKDQFDGDD